MKSSLIIICTIISSYAFADCNGRPAEAQVIGEIIEVLKTNQSNVCEVRLGNFSSYTESGVCGLDISTASLLKFPVNSCDYSVGDAASGYLSLDSTGNATWE